MLPATPGKMAIAGTCAGYRPNGRKMTAQKRPLAGGGTLETLSQSQKLCQEVRFGKPHNFAKK